MSLLDRTGVEAAPFARDLARHADRMAVATVDGSLTYAELADRVDDAAGALGSIRRLVMIATANRLDGLVAYLASLRAGHPALLVPSDRPTTVERMVAAFDPDVVVGAGGAGFETIERRARTAHELHPDLALLLCTSGSTGAPRLVRLSHQNLQSNAVAIAGFLGLTEADRAVTSLPLGYCYGLSVLNSHLVAGAGTVVTDASVVDDCFWDLFGRFGATNLAGVPYTFDLLDRVGFEQMSLPTLRFVTQAGGRLRPDRVRHYAELGERDGWDLIVMYGQTEATARMAYLPPALAASHPGSVGVPIPGGSFDLEPVEEAHGSDEGELVYRGPNVMLGYADGPSDLALGSTVDALHTGDLARRTRDGLYEIVGRRSRFTKVYGLRVDLQHLEELLTGVGVGACCAGDDEGIVVAITDDADTEAARQLVQAESGLPPTRVVLVHLRELPRLPSGKPDHAAVVGCARLQQVPAPPEAPVADAGDVHPLVRRAFDELLRRSDVTGASTFVSLGGDSLSYVEMSIALEEALGDLPDAWPTTPLGELVPSIRPARSLRRLETTIVLRAIAITLVVGTHAKLFTVMGGAHLLLGVAGYNFTRFQHRSSDMVRSVARIAVPSVLWLTVASRLDDNVDISHILLVNGWFGADDGHGGYWYVEAAVQILVPLVALLSIPAVRRLERGHRFEFALLVLAVGLLVRFQLLDLPTAAPRSIRPHDIAWIFAIGWAAAEARSASHRLLVSALVAISVPGYFGASLREGLVAAGLLLLVWAPTLAVPKAITPVVGRVATASLYIYLTHWQVLPPLRDRFGSAAALGGALVAGVLAWTLSQRVTQLVGRVRQRARPAGTAVVASAAGAADPGP